MCRKWRHGRRKNRNKLKKIAVSSLPNSSVVIEFLVILNICWQFMFLWSWKINRIWSQNELARFIATNTQKQDGGDTSYVWDVVLILESGLELDHLALHKGRVQENKSILIPSQHQFTTSILENLAWCTGIIWALTGLIRNTYVCKHITSVQQLATAIDAKNTYTRTINSNILWHTEMIDSAFTWYTKCLQRFNGICRLFLHFEHSILSTTFLVVLAWTTKQQTQVEMTFPKLFPKWVWHYLCYVLGVTDL